MEGISTLLQSFADLLTPVVNFIIWIFPVKIKWLHDGELGVVTTFGKTRGKGYERGPGIHFYWLGQEFHAIQAKGGYINLPPQAIRTKDGKVVITSAVVSYHVTSAKLAILEVETGEGLEGLIGAICLDAMRRHARSKAGDELLDAQRLSGSIRAAVKEDVAELGCGVDRFLIQDLRPHEVTMVCDTILEVSSKFQPHLK